jgi:hypothetical protein
VLILSEHKVSLQNALNKFFESLGHVWQVGTASAYSQARQKVQPAVFMHLNAVACEEYYMATLVARQCHFVIRFSRQSFALVNVFWAAQAPEQVVTVAVTSKARAYVAKHHLPTTLPLRLIKVRLATGEVEVLGTDLLDAQIYPAAEFKVVYGWRWQHETYHDRLKNIFEIERFSGTSVQAIEQDFLWGDFLGDVGERLKQARSNALNGARASAMLHASAQSQSRGELCGGSGACSGVVV